MRFGYVLGGFGGGGGGGRRCTVTCKIMILFVVLWFSYVHTNLFIDLVCLMDLDVSKGARLDSAEAQRDGTL